MTKDEMKKEARKRTMKSVALLFTCLLGLGVMGCVILAIAAYSLPLLGSLLAASIVVGLISLCYNEHLSDVKREERYK